MKATDEARIALPKLVAVGVFTQAKHRQRAPLGLAEPRRICRPADVPEAPRDRLQGIRKVAPRRRWVGAVRRELSARPLPPAQRALRMLNLVGAHAVEIIVPSVVLPDMVEAQEPPGARPVEICRLQRRLELAGRAAAGDRALRLRSLYASVQSGLLRCH